MTSPAHAFAAKPDLAKCSGVGCDSITSCLRYLREDAGRCQAWAAYFALPECDGYLPVSVELLQECAA